MLAVHTVAYWWMTIPLFLHACLLLRAHAALVTPVSNATDCCDHQQRKKPPPIDTARRTHCKCRAQHSFQCARPSSQARAAVGGTAATCGGVAETWRAFSACLAAEPSIRSGARRTHAENGHRREKDEVKRGGRQQWVIEQWREIDGGRREHMSQTPQCHQICVNAHVRAQVKQTRSVSTPRAHH